MYIAMKYQHYVDIHHHQIFGHLKFHVICKQTNDTPSNIGVQFIYASNIGISLTKTWKQLTIIMESWYSNNFYNYDTLAQQHKHATFIKYRLNQIIKYML